MEYNNEIMENYKFKNGAEYAVMSRDEVREFDRWAISEMNIPGVVLMENAGRSCAEVVRERLKGIKKAKVCIFCGTGNNGGDGYVIARHLFNSGIEVTVVICGDKGKISGDAATNLAIIERMGIKVEILDLGANADISGKVEEFSIGCSMIIDGLFGTGLKGRLGSEYIQLIESINATKLAIVAVDIPSGLDCDTGKPLGAAIRATATVTFAAVKKGFIPAESREYTGELIVASIGIEPELYRRIIHAKRD
jgi:NAD(P)H-hydrate epimerase